VQRVALREALGLRLAEEITSDRDYPPFDKAVMDGFAVRAADVASAGGRFGRSGTDWRPVPRWGTGLRGPASTAQERV